MTRSPARVEVDRILALPVQEPPDAEDLEVASFERLSVEAFSTGERLLPGQAHGLREYDRVGGGIVPLGVGEGKSLLAWMVAQRAVALGRARKVLLLVPAHLVEGMLTRHLQEARRMAPISLTVHCLAGRPRALRGRLAASGAPGCYVLPYSILSAADALDLLRAVDADLVVADEAHNLRHPRAARTKRLLAWARERARPPALFAMSGTLTSKGIMDYHALSTWALGDGSPLPASPSAAHQWSMVLDAGATPPPGMAESVLGPLMRWAGTLDAREAYQRRLRTAPGVVTSRSSDGPRASLLVRNVDPGAPSARLREMVTTVRESYETPQGDPIDHAIHTYKWLQELSAGFYNLLRWQTPAEHAAHRRGVSESEATRILDAAREHLEAERRYHRELRAYLEESPPGLDTPLQVALAVSRDDGRVPGAVAGAWRRARSLDFPGRPDRVPEAVRVDDYKIRAAVAWARERGRGVVFYHHREIGEWLVEAMKVAGLDPMHCPAGEAAAAELEAVGDPARGGRGDRLCVASVGSHGTGRNLQAFSEVLLVQWPRSAAAAEQALGRLHRTGQEADEVVATTLLGMDWDHQDRAATLVDAAYVRQTWGTMQRVLTADYDPMPEVWPPEFLRERGFEVPADLDEKQRKYLAARFVRGRILGVAGRSGARV